MASYPSAVKTFTTKSDGAGNKIFASHINDLQDEVTAIEDGILNGTAPITSSRVVAASLSVAGNSTIGGAFSVAGNSTVSGSFSVGGSASITGSLLIGGGISVATGSTFGGDVALNGAIFGGGQRSTQLSTGDIHNISGANVSFLYILTNSSGSTITGFAGTGSGQILRIFNAGPSAVLGIKNSSGSVSSNQFLLPSDTNLAVGAGATFYHSDVANRWVRVG